MLLVLPFGPHDQLGKYRLNLIKRKLCEAHYIKSNTINLRQVTVGIERLVIAQLLPVTKSHPVIGGGHHTGNETLAPKSTSDLYFL